MNERGVPAGRLILVSALSIVVLGGCTPTSLPQGAEPQAAGGPGPVAAGPDRSSRGGVRARHRVRRIDPRRGGFEITLGEWAVTPEAPALRPGRVTFVITNRGTMAHGFEIELESDSSGRGSGDLFKAESSLLQPGQTTRMTVHLPLTGVYKIECLVDRHDDMGMEGPLRVIHRAQKVATEAPTAPDRIAITDFSFDPPVLAVPAGTEVTWLNEDPTDHTVTASDGAFTSVQLGESDVFTHRFPSPGVFGYRCAIHPEMKGKVKVE